MTRTMTTYRVPVALGDRRTAAKSLQTMQPDGYQGFPIPFLTVEPPEQMISTAHLLVLADALDALRQDAERHMWDGGTA